MENEQDVVSIEEYMDKILEVLKDKIDTFYLAGGTALSKFYFNHRGSYDLDFFTQQFSVKEIEEIVTIIQNALKLTVELRGKNLAKENVQVRTYVVKIDSKNGVKLDFVEDYCPILVAAKKHNGIFVLSQEDLYLRKIFAMCGVKKTTTDEGKIGFVGGRQEAKDYFDIYCLSTIFMPFSDFILKYACETETVFESVVIWHKRYSRFEMKCGLLDLITKVTPDARLIEKHLDNEVDKLIERLS